MAQASLQLSPKERILAKATELFYCQGIKSTGIDTIIAQSGVAKATFYKHYPSKAQLVEEYMAGQDGRFFAWLETAVDFTAPEPQRLRQFLKAIDTIMHNPTFRGCSFINALAEGSDRTAHEKNLCREHKRRFLKFIERVIPGNADQRSALAEEVLIVIEGVTLRRVVENDPSYSQVGAHMILRLFSL